MLAPATEMLYIETAVTNLIKAIFCINKKSIDQADEYKESTFDYAGIMCGFSNMFALGMIFSIISPYINPILLLTCIIMTLAYG